MFVFLWLGGYTQPKSSILDKYNPNIPQPASLGDYSDIVTMGSPFINRYPTTTNPYSDRIRAQNEQMTRDYERYMRERQEAHFRNERMIDEALASMEETNRRLVRKEGYENYLSTWNEVVGMINTQSYNLKDAVYKIESFYNPSYMSYEEYTRFIDDAVVTINNAIEREGYNCDDDMAKKMMLHRFMTGVIEWQDEQGNHMRTRPMLYDFDDPLGNKQTENLFVLKLIKTNKGQCTSLPLFYLIMAEELGFDAYLSFSPNHSFIKLQDDKGEWHNLELTNGHYTNDHFHMHSGYVSAEAIRQGIFLKPVDTEGVLLQQLNTLNSLYLKKFGYDLRLKANIDQLVKTNPTNITGWLMLSNMLTHHLMYRVDRYGIQNDEEFNQHEDLVQLGTWRMQGYETIDNLGYSSMSLENYIDWLKSFNDSHKKEILKP